MGLGKVRPVTSLTRLAQIQAQRPWWFVAAALGVTLASLPFALQISMNGDFTALLPEHKKSVQDLDEIQRRFGGKATLTVMSKSEDIPALRAFVAELAPRIQAMEDRGVLYVDWNVSNFVRFAEERKYLYASLEDLEEIYDALAQLAG